MHLLALSTAFARRAGVLCCVFFMMMSAQALAQTSATDNPGSAVEKPLDPAAEKPAAEEKQASRERVGLEFFLAQPGQRVDALSSFLGVDRKNENGESIVPGAVFSSNRGFSSTVLEGSA